MKKTTKLSGAAVLAAVILFSLVTCGNASDDSGGKKGERPYKGQILVVANEQVWEHEDNAHRLGDAYFESTENGVIYIYSIDSDTLAEGEIIDGKLSFTLGELKNVYEIDDDVLDTVFHNWWDNVSVVEPIDKKIGINAVKSMYYHGDEGAYGLIFKEKLVGTSHSIALETLVFIFVDEDCRITGDVKHGMVPGTGYFASEPLDLPLKQGWNIVSEEMLYDMYHVEMDISLEVKNLVDFKWAIWMIE